jgi:hypothetical protein
MRQVKCNGCGLTEDENVPRTRQTIKPVQFIVVEDPRSSVPEGKLLSEGDLCDNCVGHVKSRYLKVTHDEAPELPSFIEPPQSLRAVEGQ